MRQRNNKASLINFLITETNTIVENPDLIRSRWIVNGMVLFRPLKACQTYDLYFQSFMKFISPPKFLEPIQIEIANDIYKYESARGNTRTKRGIEQQRTVLTSASQNMLQPDAWKSFFNNINNKINLINLLAAYLRSNSFSNQIQIPVIVNDDKNTWKNTREFSEIVFKSSHEEAGTRIILHVLQRDTKVVTVSKDTDVLILLVYAYAKYKPTKEWYMKIDANKFACIKSIVEYLGSNISVCLPQIHALTGSDTTSYLFNASKTKISKRVQENMNSLLYIKNLVNSTVLEEGAKSEIFKFIQRICYDGKETESLSKLRVRLYRNMKTKSSQNMPADKYYLEQHILLAHYLGFGCMLTSKSFLMQTYKNTAGRKW